MEVWLGRVAGVATLTDLLTALYVFSLGDGNASLLEMCEKAVFVLSVFDRHVVAANVALERIEPSIEIRRIPMAIARRDDYSISRREN